MIPAVVLCGALMLTNAQTNAPLGRQDHPRAPTGVLVPSNQILRPVGMRAEFTARPTDIAISPDGQSVAVAISTWVAVYSFAGVFQRTLLLPAAATYSGLAFSPDGKRLAVSSAAGVTLFWMVGEARPVTIPVPDKIPCGLVFDPARPFLYVALNGTNMLARIDLNQSMVTATIDVAVAPLNVTLTPDGRQLFISNWGGRRTVATDLTASSAGSKIVVDKRGVAASGIVSVVDLSTFVRVADIEVGLHPGGIQASPDGKVVAVANANSDSVSLIDPSSLAVVATVNLPAYPEKYIGSSPTSVAFGADSNRLYVSCAGNNSVTVLALRNGIYEVDNVLPTDWYPVAVAAISRSGGDVVFVANAKGSSSRAGVAPFSASKRPGSLIRIDMQKLVPQGPPRKHLGPPTIASLNAPFQKISLPVGSPSNLAELGIQHVFLIIKENRTYDQVLGDLPVGNGDPGLSIYGRDVTPNHHALASGFVTLDNFSATGVVSADGHQWITQAMASDYIERSAAAGWPRSYPYSGEDPLAFAPTGFIWDNALGHGLSVRVYGEFTLAAIPYTRSWTEYLLDAASPQLRYATPSRNTVTSTANIIERDYPTFAMNVPDQFRARIFLDKFRQFVSQGQMPNLVLIWLPADHTAGTAPGAPSPASMVADNDLALGNIVEAISSSPYWASSAIFVTEDDSQDGVDHVDGHRTICLVASPYARRAALDSTSYNQTSIVRTIEDLLGLPPMNKFDAAALPMRSVFTTTPDFTPYRALPNGTSLWVMNANAGLLKGREQSDALASQKMNFSVPDAAPERTLNRILWRAAKGPNAKYPKVPHRPDCEVDDDEGTEMKK